MSSLIRSLTVIVLFITPSLASPIDPSIFPQHVSRSDDEEHPEWGCPFPGNSDLYGLGIRLGVYLQLLSTLLANAFLSRSLRDDAHNTNAIIMIAIFAGMVNATIRGDLNAVEIFVMGTLLTAFLWSEFTPRHISGVVLFDAAGTSWDGVNKKRIYKEKRDKRIKEQWVVDEIFNSSKENFTSDHKEAKNSYFAAILRSILGTAIGLFNLWYWLDGRHVLLKNGIDDPVCEPTIFLHRQIELSGYQPMLYIILSVVYAIWEVTFMVWWVFILAPGATRLIYDVVLIMSISICTFKFKRLGEIRPKLAEWYLGFARLDEKKLRVFSFMRMKPNTQECVRRWKFYFTWWGYPIGYSVIIWSTLAIELTLAWNSASGIYVLGSTGQLIPFVVGMLGFLRNVHLIAVKISEGTGRKKKEREIQVNLEEAKFFYGDGKDARLWLEAGRPMRRRSIDSEFPLLERCGRRDSVAVSSERSLRSATWKSEG